MFGASPILALGTLTLDPENPTPYSDIKITFKTYDFDADTAMFTWSINKKIVLTGKGEKTIETKVGGIKSTTLVSVKIETSGGEIINSYVEIRPQSIDLTWESTESYIPPFYEGKALPGEDSAIVVIATPSFSFENKLIAPEEISYSWYLNDQFIINRSGRGRQILNTRLDYLSNKNVFKVVAKSDNGGTAENSITIYPNDISPIFYLKDPVLGLDLTRAIEKRFETTKEFTLSLVPYFISSKNGLGSSISYDWSMNGLPINPDSNTDVTLKPKDNSSGSKTLSVSIDNPARQLQTVKSFLNIIFDTRQ